MTPVSIGSAAELRDTLRAAATDGRRLRLRGTGSRPRLLPEPPPGTATLDLGGLASIERLETDDLTCSVQPGVRCRELTAELERRGLELGAMPADDDGTVGGLYSADPLGPPNPGVASPRSTLLGLEAVLADGTAFRSGARVVKSVAGFDVHRLFVGSRGRVCAATLLHLKLRPAPRARAGFATDPEELSRALPRFLALRGLPSPPQRLMLRREPGGGFRIHGRITGRASQVAATLRRHDLREAGAAAADHLPEPAAGRELLVGIARVSSIERLLAAAPADAPFLLHGGGHFEAEMEPAALDRLLPALPSLGAHAAVAFGPRASTGTPLDPGALRLQRAMFAALDPREVLA